MDQSILPTTEKDQPLLLVDDDPDFLAILGDFLVRLGYRYDTAMDGEEALHKISTFTYPLVLTSNIQLPKLDGLQLIEQVKTRFPDTDIIVIIGNGHSFGHTESIAAGAIDYIAKPFLRQELETKLKRAFRERLLKRTFREAMEAQKKEKAGLSHALRELKTKFEEQSFELNETHTALRVMVRQRAHDQRAMREDLSTSIKDEVRPLLDRLRHSHLNETQRNLLDVVSTHLEILYDAEAQGSARRYAPLTPTEYRIANLIKQRKTSKEIAGLLNISTGTVRSHRENIRKKLRITNQKKNLYKTLLSIA